MEDKACLSCGINVPQKEGKKPRLYCGSICRQRDWYKKRKEALDRLTGKGGIPLPADYVNYKHIGILKEDGTVEPIDFANVPEPWKMAVRAMGHLQKDAAYIPLDIPKGSAAEEIIDQIVSKAENKPKAAPKPEKLPSLPKEEEKAVNPPQNGSESDPGIMFWLKKAESEGKEVGVKPASPEQMKETIPQPPEGLTEIQLMVWKNEQKKKNNPKPPAIEGYGLTKKTKNGTN